MNCPKRYGSYDVRNDDCPHCKQGFLYQACSVGKDHPACAGWNDKDGSPQCCNHCAEKEDLSLSKGEK
jgi:hypothetical protein